MSCGVERSFPMVDPDTDDTVVGPIFEALKRAGVGPLNIHRVLAHAPGFYAGFAAFASALRGPGSTTRADRELVILRTLLLRNGEYEYIQHRRIALSVGITVQQVDSLRDWRDASCFDTRQCLLLEFTDSMILEGGVQDALFQRLCSALTSAEIVEVALVSSFYTAVSQFSRAIPLEPEKKVTNYGE